MPTNAEIFKDFLVNLGFKVDPASFRKFNSSILQATGRVLELGEVAVGTTTAIETMVSRVAKRMTDLYYASERTGETVGNIEALQYGFRAAGLSADDATKALEGVARAMRENPGKVALLQQLGIDTKNADTALHGLVERLSQMPFYIAAQYAQMFGINEQELLMLEKHLTEVDEKTAQFAKTQRDAGIDAQDLASKSRDFGLEMNKLDGDFQILTERLEKDFLPIATKVVEWADEAVQWFTQLDKETDGWAGIIGGSGVAALTAYLAQALLLKGALSSVAKAGAAATVALTDPILLALLGIGVGAAGAYFGGKYLAGQTGGSTVGVDAGTTGMPIYADPTNDPLVGMGAKIGRMFGGGGGSNPEDLISFFMAKGWTRAQAAGIVANLQKESGLNASASGDGGQAYGVAQWHPDRQAAFKKWAGYDIKQSSLNEQLAFIDHELRSGDEQEAGRALAGTSTAEQAGAVASRMYERPGDVLGQMTERAQMAGQLYRSAPEVHQTNNIVINGITDPHGVEMAVGNGISHSNGDLIRNLAGVVQ